MVSGSYLVRILDGGWAGSTPLANTPKCDSTLPTHTVAHTRDCQHHDGEGEMKKKITKFLATLKMLI